MVSVQCANRVIVSVMDVPKSNSSSPKNHPRKIYPDFSGSAGRVTNAPSATVTLAIGVSLSASKVTVYSVMVSVQCANRVIVSVMDVPKSNSSSPKNHPRKVYPDFSGSAGRVTNAPWVTDTLAIGVLLSASKFTVCWVIVSSLTMTFVTSILVTLSSV